MDVKVLAVLALLAVAMDVPPSTGELVWGWFICLGMSSTLLEEKVPSQT